MSMVNAFEPGKFILSAHEQELIDRRNRSLGPAYRLFYEHPVHIVRGQGVWLYDAAGEAYLDVYNNVPCVGHCHPHVVEALIRQATVLNTHTRYLHETVLDYAERLLRTFPKEIGHAMFTCTGSEANDLAYRIALSHTGGEGFIVTQLAYHGATKVIAELSPSLGESAVDTQKVRLIPRPASKRDPAEDAENKFAAGVAGAIEDMRRHGIKPAALIVDTIFSSDGVYSDPPGFLRKAVETIREAGGLFIADEVQAGFGRTGDGMWGFARHGVIPDIVTMGKSMGAGHPIAGIAVRPDVVKKFSQTRYFNTFGGNPVSAAVGLAVLDVIEKEQLIANARNTGAYLRAGLEKLAAKHSIIGDVRGAGLFVGVEMVRDRKTFEPASAETTRIVNQMREKKILISATGPFANSLKVRPPLPFSIAHADQFLAALDDVLRSL